MKHISVELLLNRRSRRTREVRAELFAALKNHGFEVTHTNEISKRTSMSELLVGIAARKPKLLIVAGGDGTISGVVNHLTDTAIEIGLVPLGTTNNFARSLDIPRDIDGAVQTIKKESGHRVDLGRANGKNFTNVAGVGMSARIAANVTNITKRRWGRLAYGIVALQQLTTHRPFTVTVEDPALAMTVTLETHQVIVASGKYHAGRQIAVDAAVDNGQLIIFALGGRSRLSLIFAMLDFYAGKRKRVVHASYFIGRDVRLRTNRPQPVELDGEVRFDTPLTISIETAAIKIRYKK